jgi:PAS domain S-box-containing protein/putative nucleotidyltransferase with HDIG domain
MSKINLDYRAIVETGVDMFIITNEDGIISYASPQWEHVLGYAPEAMVGKNRWHFMSEDDVSKTKAKFLPYYKRRLPFYLLTHNMIHKDGQRVTIESSGAPIFNKKGDFEGYRVNNRNVSSRSLIENADVCTKEDAYAILLDYQEVITGISKMFMDSPFDHLDKAINQSLSALGHLLKICRVYVFEFDDTQQTMSNTFEWCKTGIESTKDMLQNLSVDIFPWWMKKLHRNEVINVYDIHDMDIDQINEQAILLEQEIKSILVVPMHVDQKLVGFIGFDAVLEHKQFQDEIHLIRMYSEIVGYALIKQKDEHRILRSIQHVKTTFSQTVEAFSSLLEISDPYTSGHQRRVAELSLAIAKKLNFSTERQEALHMAALLHDLGKFYIPAQILNKPGKLSQIEFDLVKTHSAYGYQILSKIDFPWPIADMVHQHHERLDGSGYPLGLKEDAILLEAQIIGVADIVEAITSHRPYRPALGLDFALVEINRLKGLQYHASVVDVCTALFETGEFQFDLSNSLLTS